MKKIKKFAIVLLMIFSMSSASAVEYRRVLEVMQNSMHIPSTANFFWFCLLPTTKKIILQIQLS
jgi:hypothetical protein